MPLLIFLIVFGAGSVINHHNGVNLPATKAALVSSLHTATPDYSHLNQ